MSGRSTCRRNRMGVRRLALGGIAVLAVLGAAGMSWAGADGSCVSVKVDAPIQLPDGRIHPSGTLTLCDTIGYSPVATLHKTRINGQAIGLLMSRKRTSEAGPTAEPTVLFRRIGEGSLELVGYVVPSRGRSVTYLLNPSPRTRLATDQVEPESLLALAAR